MELWKATVPFFNNTTNQDVRIMVQGRYREETPIIDIDDDLLDKASDKLYAHFGDGDWEMDVANYDGPESV